MRFYCRELNKWFDSQRDMFLALKENQTAIVGVKKAQFKEADAVSFVQVKAKTADKADIPQDQTIKVGDYVYPIINTTNWLDSYRDVHIDGIWDVSIKDQKGRLYYVINHDLKVGSVIAYPNDVEAFVKTFTWEELGKSYPGTTQALVFKVLLTDAANKDALSAIIGRKPLQNSVRMEYISFTLCVNDKSDDFKQEYENFYKYLATIANKEDALEYGYFWAVTQAKISREGSAVLFGANEVTPILTESEINSSPSDDSSKNHIDPAQTSQQITKGSSLLLL